MSALTLSATSELSMMLIRIIVFLIKQNLNENQISLSQISASQKDHMHQMELTFHLWKPTLPPL